MFQHRDEPVVVDQLVPCVGAAQKQEVSQWHHRLFKINKKKELWGMLVILHVFSHEPKYWTLPTYLIYCSQTICFLWHHQLPAPIKSLLAPRQKHPSNFRRDAPNCKIFNSEKKASTTARSHFIAGQWIRNTTLTLFPEARLLFPS